MHKLLRFLKDNSGEAAIEDAIKCVLIAVVIVAAIGVAVQRHVQ